jgi:hypothetical protein
LSRCAGLTQRTTETAVLVVAFGVAAAQVASGYSRNVPTSAWFTGTGSETCSASSAISGGVEGVGYAHGLILGVIYVVVAIAAAMTVFIRNDVTAWIPIPYLAGYGRSDSHADFRPGRG